VIVYLPYRNPDPPALVAVWNQAATARGAFPIRTPSLLERWVFSKPYFEPAALTVAQEIESQTPVGFSLAGFGPNADLSGLDKSNGVIAAVLVKPEFRRQGIGRELVRRAENYLTERGATRITIGSQRPNNPYLFGLYGGSNSPGILDSDADAKPFLAKLGYEPADRVFVFQRRLDEPINLADPRLVLLRKRYDVQMLKAAVVESWWNECVWSTLDPAEFRAVDKLTGMPAARATAWELEGFGWKWNYPSAGIIDVQVRPDLRKQGLAKMLVTHILRTLQDQFFGIGELMVSAEDPSAVGLCKSVGFEQVDIGFAYRKAN
jgi:ribosomal protein S18 acetylase RimI-like enzyme